MAARKQTVEEQIEKDEIELSPLTIQSAAPEKRYNGPVVSVFLPALEDNGDGGLKVDQYEHVTIANEKHEMHWKIHRGMHVEVPVPVYCVLKESGRYPNI